VRCGVGHRYRLAAGCLVSESFGVSSWEERVQYGVPHPEAASLAAVSIYFHQSRKTGEENEARAAGNGETGMVASFRENQQTVRGKGLTAGRVVRTTPS